jgi:predicted aspartyl protease
VQLAPSSQFGQYSQSILSRIDPQGGSNSSSRSSSSYNPSGSRLTGGGDNDNGLDTSIPREWDVPCLRGPDGQIFVNAEVEGKPIRLLFDTGAPTCFIGKNQLEATGIPVPAGPPNSSTSGSTSTAKVPAWSLKMRIKLGPVERRVITMVTDTNSAEPLIGQSYFGRFLYTIDSGAGRIHFKQKVLDTGDNRFATNVPFVWQEQGNRIIVEVEINGRRGKALFDTGNTASALSFFTVDQATQFGIKVPDDAEVSINTGISGSAAVKRFHVGRIRLGAIDRSDVPITVGDAHGPGDYPLLGAPFWQGYEYTINKEKRQIQFVRR